MKRIILHWSGGASKPNQTDLLHYHFVVDSDGKVSPGKFKPEDNEVCKNDANNNALYAQHCGGGNTGSIGIALCGMYGFKGLSCLGKYQLTKVQCEASFKLAAELCKKYNLDLSKADTIQTHYGFGKRHPNTSSAGKVDIIWLPHGVFNDKVEDFIRQKVRWYYKNCS